MKNYFKNFVPPILYQILKLTYNQFLSISSYGFLKKNTKLKNIGKGRRITILGSSPDLKNKNLDFLKSENLIALNNFYLHLDFNKIFKQKRPNLFYLIAPIHPPQKEKEWKKWLMDLDKNIPNHVIMLIGQNFNKINSKILIEKYEIFKSKDVYYYYGIINKDLESFGELKKSHIDFSKFILNCGSASIYALIFSIYTNFDKIYLMGIEHNYILFNETSQMRFYKENKIQKNEFKRMFKDSKLFYVYEYKRQFQMFLQYYRISEMVENKIFDLSPNGLLKFFEKKNENEVYN